MALNEAEIARILDSFKKNAPQSSLRFSGETVPNVESMFSFILTVPEGAPPSEVLMFDIVTLVNDGGDAKVETFGMYSPIAVEMIKSLVDSVNKCSDIYSVKLDVQKSEGL